MDLDRPDDYAAVDAADALADVEATAEQWATGRGLGGTVPPVDLDAVDSVVVTGMGGSGIVGDVVATVAAEHLPVPVLVHKGYGLPAFAGPRTVVVAVSYSGNTEETASAVEAAFGAGAPVLGVTSGGALGDSCAERGAPVVTVPADPPTRGPRHSLGLLAAPVLVALGLGGGVAEAVEVLGRLAEAQGRHVATADNPAKRLALRLAGDGAVLAWGERGPAGVAAYRLRCQLAENAKLTALSAELPELCHNDVVGWQEPSPLRRGAGLVLTRDPAGEHPRVTRRIDALHALLGDQLDWREEVTAVGQGVLARLASLLLQVDLATVYAAIALDRDPTPIPYIDRLKAAIS